MKVTVGTQTTDAPEWWTVTDIAEHLGIGESTWRGYVSRRFAPPPDDPGDPTAHPKRRIPRWRPDTIHAWQATRRGRGTRRKTATQLRPSPASPAVTTRPVALPEQDHPLYSLFVQRHALRELAINADRSCQAIAPHPSTLADPDPLDTLHGEIRDTYVTLRSRRETYEHAAYMLDIAIAHVVDNLGGM